MMILPAEKNVIFPPVTSPGQVGMWAAKPKTGVLTANRTIIDVYNQLSSLVYEASVHGDICKASSGNGVSPEFVRSALKYACVVGIRYTRPTASSKTTVLGFIIARPGEREKDDFFVDVLCARKGNGAPLMRAALQFARENGYRTASLSALPHVQDYYTQFRFMAGKGDPCAPNAAPQRIAATGGSSSEGFRFRKCLTGTSARNNYVNAADRWRYALPPRASASAVTRETGQRSLSRDTTRRSYQHSSDEQHFVSSNNDDDTTATSRMRHAPPVSAKSSTLSKVCKVVRRFVDSGLSQITKIIKVEGRSVRIKLQKTSWGAFQVKIELVNQRAIFEYDSLALSSVYERDPGRYPWMSELKPCIEVQARRWMDLHRRGRKPSAGAQTRAARVLTAARTALLRSA